MSWAEVKKINSDMSKPLNELIAEQKQFANVTLMSNQINGINYSATSTEEALGDKNENLIMSVSGSGRILWMIPFFDGTSRLSGVARLKMDGKRLFCKSCLYCSESSTNYGYSLFSETFESLGSSTRRVYTANDNYTSEKIYQLHHGGYYSMQGNISNEFVISNVPLYLPGGLYFNDRFELEAIQTGNDNIRKNAGFFVGYELYE